MLQDHRREEKLPYARFPLRTFVSPEKGEVAAKTLQRGASGGRRFTAPLMVDASRKGVLTWSVSHGRYDGGSRLRSWNCRWCQ